MEEEYPPGSSRRIDSSRKQNVPDDPPYQNRDEIGTYKRKVLIGRGDHNSYVIHDADNNGIMEAIYYRMPTLWNHLRNFKELSFLEEILPRYSNQAIEKTRQTRLCNLLQEYYFNVSPGRNIDIGLPSFWHSSVIENDGGRKVLVRQLGGYRELKIERDAYSPPVPESAIVRATLLQIAAAGGDWFTIEWAIRNGADPNAKTNDICKTPLELLIGLIQWEQQQLGEEREYSAQTIARKQKAAVEFVKAEWNQVLEQHSPTCANQVRQLINFVQTNPARLIKSVREMVFVVLTIYFSVLLYAKYV